MWQKYLFSEKGIAPCFVDMCLVEDLQDIQDIGNALKAKEKRNRAIGEAMAEIK